MHVEQKVSRHLKPLLCVLYIRVRLINMMAHSSCFNQFFTVLEFHIILLRNMFPPLTNELRLSAVSSRRPVTRNLL